MIILDELCKATLMNKECYFTALRIKESEVPSGYHRFDLRHSDENPFEPMMVQKNVWVNHFGTILTQEQLDLKEGEIFLDQGDFFFHDEIRMVME